jgi:two-component system, chemotaxis family, protein-glutamate methylesterase/glutaminase
MMVKKKSSNETISVMNEASPFAAIVIGTSAGGYAALDLMFRQIDKNFKLPLIVVQHLYPESNDFIARNLNPLCQLAVCEANEKEIIRPGHIYISPANYHLLIEADYTFSLNIDPKVNYSRPSIDVLFESAADVFKEKLIGILLTGANSDGAKGLKFIKDMGGVTIVQDPESAEVPGMPQSALNLFTVDYVLPLQEIYSKLKILSGKN